MSTHSDISRWPVARWPFRDWVVIVLGALMIGCLPFGINEARWLQADQVVILAALWGGLFGGVLAYLLRQFLPAGLVILLGALIFTVQVNSKAVVSPQKHVTEVMEAAQWADREFKMWAVDVLLPDAPNASDEPDVPSVIHPTEPAPDMREWRAALSRLRLYIWNLQTEWPIRFEPHRWNSGQVLLSTALCLIIWSISALAAWLLGRSQSAWMAMLPIALVIGISIYLSAEGWGFLIAAVTCGLMLAAEFALRDIKHRWPRGLIYEWLTQSWWLGSLALVSAVMVGMLLMVSVTDPEFRRAVREIFDPPEQKAERETSDPDEQAPREQPGIWPRNHLLGAGPEISQNPAMTVTTPGTSPADFYWRVTSYDIYTGHGWLTSTTSDSTEPLWPETISPPQGSLLLPQVFRLEFEAAQVFAAGRPVRINLPVKGIWHREAEGIDLMAIESLTRQRGYEVLSWVPVASDAELREASTEMPEWVTENYLQLPEDLPSRIGELTGEAVQGAETPYDQALAVQEYLRSNYTYTLDLTSPPPDRDVVDYFLFDLNRGYCDYYASAMVVMLRSVGIPARLSVGYHTGEYDSQTGAYHVTMADAHSWPEVYFSGYGWVPFEPTVTYTTIARGLPDAWEGQPDNDAPENNTAWLEQNSDFATRSNYPYLRWGLIGAAALVAILLLQYLIRDVWHEFRRSRGTPDEIVVSLYQDLLRAAQRFDVPLSDYQTPYEFLLPFNASVERTAQASPQWLAGRGEVVSARMTQAAQTIVEEYVSWCYSPRRPTAQAAAQLLSQWSDLRFRLRLYGLLRRFFAGTPAPQE